MKRLTYDVGEKHYCDYTTREIINRLAECEIMLDKIKEIINNTDYIEEDVIRYKMICEVVEDGDNNL